MATSRYVLTTQASFAAAHVLHGYDGDCSRLHGHNYKILVEVEAWTLDSVGLAVDFREIRRAAELVAAEFDHRHLNDLPQFEGVNPSAEHISVVVYRRLCECLDRDGARVLAVTIEETDRCSVRYSERE